MLQSFKSIVSKYSHSKYWPALVGGCLVVFLGVALVSYNLWYVRPAVKSSVNNNVRIYNQALDATKQVLSNLSEIGALQTNSLQSLRQQIEGLKSLEKDLDDLQKQIDASRNLLDTGINQTSQSFRDLIAEDFNLRLEFLSLVQEYTKYQACLFENAGGQLERLQKITDLLSSLESVDPASIAEVYTQAAGLSIENTNSVDSLRSCFVGSNQPYYDDALKSAFNEDLIFYTRFAEAAGQVADGLRSGNLDRVSQANAVISELSSASPNFFDSPEFFSVLQAPVGLIEEQGQRLDEHGLLIQIRLQSLSSRFLWW